MKNVYMYETLRKLRFENIGLIVCDDYILHGTGGGGVGIG